MCRIVLMSNVLLLVLSPFAAAAPKVVNGSFEADRYTKAPGQARANGGKIQGWQFTGSVGINPTWDGEGKTAVAVHTFDDNGIVPHGRQVVLLQNACTLSQRIEGFEAGKRYRVTFHENARRRSRSPDPPRLEVSIDGQTIVSPHLVTPVEDSDRRTLPYHFVESAAFVAPRTGALELRFKTTLETGLTVLLDQVVVEELPP